MMPDIKVKAAVYLQDAKDRLDIVKLFTAKASNRISLLE